MHKLKINLFLAFLLLLPAWASGASTEAGHWEFAGWYGGGCYPQIIADPHVKNRLYLLSDVAGAWRSDNRGQSWDFINKGLDNLQLACIAIAPSDSAVLYLGSESGMMRSLDAGGNWSFLEATRHKIIFRRPDSYRCIAVDPKDPRRLFAGTVNGGVFLSQDSGDSWVSLGGKKQIFGKGPITALCLADSGRKLFASTGAGIWMLDLHRNKWVKLKTGFGEVADMVGSAGKEIIYASTQNRVAYSLDLGRSWKLSAPIPRGQIFRLDVSSSSKNSQILAGWKDQWEGGVYLSQDGGRNWVDLEKNLAYDQNSDPTRAWSKGLGPANAVIFDPFDRKIFYFTDWWGVWRSLDSGNTWEEKIKGASNTCGTDIAISNRAEIYVSAMDSGLLKSSDFGKTYTAIFPRQAYDPEMNGHIWRVIINPQNPDQVVATSSPWNKDYSQVIISQNAGQDFILSREGLPRRRPKINTVWHEGYPRAIVFDPQDSRVIYLGIDGDDGGGLYISRDFGGHWEYSPGQPAAKGIYNGLAADPAHPQRLYWGASGARGGVYLSEDKGRSWKQVFNGMQDVFDILVSAQAVYAAGSFQGRPAVFVSTDEGKTWNILADIPQEGMAEALCVNPSNPDQICFSAVNWKGRTGGKIYCSNDKGKIWKDITGDLPDGGGASAMLFNPADSKLYIIRYSGSVYKSSRSVE